MPGVPHDEVPALLAAADICLVPLRDVPLFATFIPSKMFEYLAAGQGRDRLGHRGGRRRSCARRAPWWSRRRTAWRWPTRSARWPSARSAAGPWAGPAGPHVEQCYDRAALAREYRKILDTAGGHAMRLLVTGGSGFLGGYVLDEARRRGHDVRRPGPQRRGGRGRGQPRRRAADRRLRRSGRPRRRVPVRAGCNALLNLASLGFGHAPAIVAARPRRPGLTGPSSSPPRR